MALAKSSLFAFVVVVMSCSTQAEDLFVKSWKTGNRGVKETEIELSLTCQDQNSVEIAVQDRSGQDAFRLRAHPADECGADGTAGWVVSLFEMGYEDPEHDLLKPTMDPAQDFFTGHDFPGFFIIGTENETVERGLAALQQTRIVAVEGFYCILKATSVAYGKTGKFSQVVIKVSFFNECETCKESALGPNGNPAPAAPTSWSSGPPQRETNEVFWSSRPLVEGIALKG